MQQFRNALNPKIHIVAVKVTKKSIVAWNNLSSWIKLLKAISFLKHFIQSFNDIQSFKRHNKVIENKLSEPTKVIVEYMKKTHDVIIELINERNIQARTSRFIFIDSS